MVFLGFGEGEGGGGGEQGVGKGDERIKGEKRYKRRQTERQKENLVRSIDGQIK